MADDTAVRSAVEYYESQWPELYTPDILISFLGGCGNDFISKNAEDALSEGLSQVLPCLFFFYVCFLVARVLQVSQTTKITTLPQNLCHMIRLQIKAWLNKETCRG